eukprot:m51a1_g3582 hypothetical protein (70) ;mRNA; r:1125788-1126082
MNGLIADKKLIVRWVNDNYQVVFMDTEAFSVIGGREGGFIKNVKTRMGVAFVKQRQFEEDSAYWDEQLL